VKEFKNISCQALAVPCGPTVCGGDKASHKLYYVNYKMAPISPAKLTPVLPPGKPLPS
jgi:hypothetical protein